MEVVGYLVKNCEVALGWFLHDDGRDLAEELFIGFADGVKVGALGPGSLDEDQERGQGLEPVHAFVEHQPPVQKRVDEVDLKPGVDPGLVIMVKLVGQRGGRTSPEVAFTLFTPGSILGLSKKLPKFIDRT